MALSLLAVAGILLLLVLVIGGAYLFMSYRGLGDDWPRIPGLPVKEHSPNKWPTPPPPRRLKEITPAEFRTLCALCDTFIPSFTNEASLRRGCRAYVEELLRGGEGGEEQKEALIAELQRDMGYYKQGALATGVPLKVADVIEAEVPAGTFLCRWICVAGAWGSALFNHPPPPPPHHGTDSRRIVRMVFRAMEMPLGLLFLTGKWHGWKTEDGAAAGFSSLPFETRERIIGALLTSPIAPTRGVRACVYLN